LQDAVGLVVSKQVLNEFVSFMSQLPVPVLMDALQIALVAIQHRVVSFEEQVLFFFLVKKFKF